MLLPLHLLNYVKHRHNSSFFSLLYKKTAHSKAKCAIKQTLFA